MTPGRLYPSVRTVPLPLVPDAGRKHFLYRADPGEKPADLQSGFSEISIKNTALSIERYALYHSGRSSSSASSIGCPDPAALFCNATKVSFVIPENHTFSALPDFPDETRPAPQDILLSLLQARHHHLPSSTGYTGCIAGQGAVPHLIIFLFRGESINNIKIFLFSCRKVASRRRIRW